jgi:hypothetical protein
LPLYLTTNAYLISLLGASIALVYINNRHVATSVMMIALLGILGANIAVFYTFRKSSPDYDYEVYKEMFRVLETWILILVLIF